MTGKLKNRRIFIVTAVVFLSIYVGSYYLLSRRGFGEMDTWDGVGFYFITPKESNVWAVCNYGLVVIYYPLIVIDNAIGTGRPVGGIPLWRISKSKDFTNEKEIKQKPLTTVERQSRAKPDQTDGR